MNLFFDENFSHYMVEGLNSLQQGRGDDNHVTFIPHVLGKGVPDEEWIPWVAARNGIAVTQDVNIRRQQLQWQLCQQVQLSIIFVKPPKKGAYTYWDFVRWFVRDWEKLLDELNRTTSLACWAFKPNSIRKI